MELAGEFEASEASFIRQQFDDCRIELAARSSLDGRTALLRWTPAAGPSASAAVTDRRNRPAAAHYVLTHRPELRLTPIASAADLQARFPNHFAADAVPDPPRLRGCLRVPWLLLAAAGIAAVYAHRLRP